MRRASNILAWIGCHGLLIANLGCFASSHLDTQAGSGTGGGSGGPGGANDGGAAGGSGGGDDGNGGAPVLPFEASPPSTYVPKVKNLLTGLPATDAEVQAVTADPGALPGLIDQWMATPEWNDRMLLFFKQAFQQTQVTAIDYMDSLGLDTRFLNGEPRFIRSMEEMFPRTVLELMKEGRPFTEVVTTRRFMMNAPLMSLMAYADNQNRGDDGKVQAEGEWILKSDSSWSVTFTQSPVALADTLNPGSSSFMQWTDPTPTPPTCAHPEPVNYKGNGGIEWLEEFLFGSRHLCGRTTPAFTDGDWSGWRMVTVRAPNSGETRTYYWDLPTLRTTSELVTATPRIGFMTTPAFLANWPTNTSNTARVTTNQTMIVALGRAFDDRGVTVRVASTSDDQQHAQPGTSCYGCHQTLDPMRDFFRQSYTYFYGERGAKAQAGIPATGTFSVDGSAPVTGTGIATLAEAIAQHPRFAIAWTQKLCRFANSTSCSEDDPEFQRVAQAFESSGFDFRRLVRELFSSPLVTYASDTKSSDDQGQVVSIARRDSLCTSLSNRLGLADACGIFGQRKDAFAANVASAVPGDGYARGAEEPLLPTESNLFHQSGTSNLCVHLATLLVDAPSGSKYSSSKAAVAIPDFVHTVMGVPSSDPRSSAFTDILQRHFNAAQSVSKSATVALRSTFTVACASPLSISSGL